jgi:hypothetical protein
VRNYNAAMDKHSDCLMQPKGTNRKSEYFNQEIGGHPKKIADIEVLTGTMIPLA